LEEVDAGCREDRISASAARLALPPLVTEYWYEDRNCYELLWGSRTPLARPPEEVRRLLTNR
jgi:hypothetical protein